MLDFDMLPDPNLAGRWRGLKASDNFVNMNNRDKFYQGSYRFILSHVTTCSFDGSSADCERFWQALILIYSWMARGLLSNFDNHSQRYQKACPALSSIRHVGKLDHSEIPSLLNLCNDRIVGVSKLLHFLRPDRFAIWDSRVGTSLFGSAANSHQVNMTVNYLAYLDWIRLVALDATTEHQVAAHLGLNPTIASLRPKEFILFITSTRPADD